jgi:hypothetical protein
LDRRVLRLDVWRRRGGTNFQTSENELSEFEMSEGADLPERGADGRFAASEQAFGIDAVEQSMGYTQNQKSAPPASDDILADEAIAVASFFPEGDDVDSQHVIDGITELSAAPATYIDRATGDKLDPNITVRLEEAADNLTAYESELASYVEGLDLSLDLDAVDSARAEAVKDPKLAEEYGLDPKEVADNAKRLEPEAEAKAEPANEPPTNEPEIPGLDPEVAKAVRNPQVRQFLEEQVTQAETTRQQYANALDTANALGMSRLNELLPDVSALPPHQREAGLALLAQTDPQRFQAALQEMNRIGQVQQAQAQQQQYSAARNQAAFNEWAKAEDAKLNVTDADAKSVQAYLKDNGMLDEWVHGMRTDPGIRSAKAQQIVMDAARYHAIKNAPKAVATRPSSHVQRPGSASVGKSSKDVSLAALEAKLNRSGSEADAWAYLQARMKG